ncbi:MAG TPA: vitamin K epoxide reductase family protein [Chitinophagaceae bacterium]|nr:vitamin K epoxide reductase family protein [Chitinophagaceae bacterium]
MKFKLPELIKQWLHYQKMRVSSAFLKEKLLSHPDYPSLLSITDTLDDLSIENAAIEIDKETLHQVPAPFIAHVNAKGGHFILVTNTTKLLSKQPDFLEQWKGVVLLAERPASFHHPENEEWLKREKKNTWLKGLAIIVLTASVAFAVSLQFSWFLAGLVITTTTGLFASILIVQHELGVSNSITEQLCGAGKNTDCDAVLHSKKSKLFRWLNWADIGIIWFCSQFLLITVSLFTGIIQAMIPFLCVLCIATLPFTLFSFYYQWRVVKKWCTLCLLTIAVLWGQVILLLPEILTINFQYIPVSILGLIIFTGYIVFTGWLLLLKPGLKERKEIKEKNHQLQRFKNNPEIFEALLYQQRTVNPIPLEHDLQLGNADAQIQIIVACNPYCGPCAKAHQQLQSLAEKNDIGFTIRFLVNADKPEDKRTRTVAYILQLLIGKGSDYKNKVLNDWYAIMDFEKFKQQYSPGKETAVSILLKQHEQWADTSKIFFTPTVFINGYEMPKQYSISELPNLIKILKEKTEQQAQEENIIPQEMIPI